jgi:hypothetical protein
LKLSATLSRSGLKYTFTGSRGDFSPPFNWSRHDTAVRSACQQSQKHKHSFHRCIVLKVYIRIPVEQPDDKHGANLKKGTVFDSFIGCYGSTPHLLPAGKV